MPVWNAKQGGRVLGSLACAGDLGSCGLRQPGVTQMLSADTCFTPHTIT